MARWLSVAVCLGFGSRAAAEEAAAPRERLDQRWRVVELASDAGLSRQNIFNFDFEANGTVWLAASGGLLRYDGYRWQRFGMENGLPSHFVRSVLVTKDGVLWVGTDKGVGTYDGHTFDPKGSDKGLAGPSVRRIVEDPDGTLWFCSDRWPDASVTSGISSYHNGVWHAYTERDGLASEHVYTYFRDSHGRQFALTRNGVSQRFGERWGPPEGGAAFANAQCWSMAEARGIGVVARSSDAFFISDGGPWRRIADTSSRHNGMCPSFCMTRSGEVVTCDFDGKRYGFYRWNGHDIELISPVIDARDHSIEFIREAPDGAIWTCMYGNLQRWQRSGGEWTEYVNLPFPRAIDRRGRVWFGDEQSAYRLDGDTFVATPELAGQMALNGQGDVWSWRSDDKIKLFSDEIRTFSERDTGLRTVEGHTRDTHGQSWFHGQDADGNAAVALYDGAHWTRMPIPGKPRRPIVESAVDPISGVWYLLIEPDQRSVSCVHLDRTKTESLTTEYGGIVYAPPHLSVDHEGNLWLSGQAGMYRLDRKNPAQWERIVAIAGNDVGKGVVRDDEIWFPYNGWTGGESGFAVYRGGAWRYFNGDYSDLLEATPDGTLYVGIEQGLNIIPPGANAVPSQLTFPDGQRVHSLVKEHNGDLWMGVVQPDGSVPTVFRYRPDHQPPETELSAVPTEVREDRKLVVKASARERFEPKQQAHTYRFSWRFDDDAWSTFQPLPADGLSMAALSPGVHRIQIRAQDEGFDADPTPSEAKFTVLPIPLQERSWFKPAVAAVFIVIFVLAIFAAERARRFARANVQLQRAHERLEDRVAERTAELSQSNDQLAAEIAERKRAQTELESVQGRLLETSRQAGMAEVATSVLHNVGNVLNSVNVATMLVMDRMQASKVASLPKLSALLQENSANLGEFIMKDARGQRIPEYIAKLSDALTAERKLVLDELKQLRNHVDHIKQIVAMQQSYAKISGVVETIPVTELLEDALRMNGSALERHGVAIERVYNARPTISVERHKVLQILVNLIRNAKYACDESGREDKRLTLKIDATDESVQIAVIDNGVGIPPENLTRIFAHGFTTRKTGHGFGLHSGALTAKELGGALTASSGGPGQGATFLLRLPLSPPSAMKNVA